jgi:hypothetical protein
MGWELSVASLSKAGAQTIGDPKQQAPPQLSDRASGRAALRYRGDVCDLGRFGHGNSRTRAFLPLFIHRLAREFKSVAQEVAARLAVCQALHDSLAGSLWSSADLGHPLRPFHLRWGGEDDMGQLRQSRSLGGGGHPGGAATASRWTILNCCPASVWRCPRSLEHETRKAGLSTQESGFRERTTKAATDLSRIPNPDS